MKLPPIEPEVFPEAHYLFENPDVKAAVEAGVFRSGEEHWLQHGRQEWLQGSKAGPDRRVISVSLDKQRWLVVYPAGLAYLGEVSLRLSGMASIDMSLPFDNNLFLSGPGVHSHFVILDAGRELSGAREVILQIKHSTGTEERTIRKADPKTRHPIDVLGFFAVSDAINATTTQPIDSEQRGELARRLSEIFEIQERLGAEEEVFGNLDKAWRVGDDLLFIEGWCLAIQGTRHLWFCDMNTLTRIDLLPTLSLRVRTDVVQHYADKLPSFVDSRVGFYATVEYTYDSDASSAPVCYVAIEDYQGNSLPIKCPFPPTGPWRVENGVAGVQRLLGYLDPASPNVVSDIRNNLSKAIEVVWQSERERKLKVTETVYGTPSAEPLVSIIVPIFGRSDFIEYQQALFANDPEFVDFELIYYIDDPRMHTALPHYLTDLHALYRVPFKVIYGSHNVGYARANNQAARAATGEYILLLNSDVMPQAPGWIGRLVETHRGLPDCGVLGIRLLYGDDSIQHAAMTFEPFPVWSGMYGNYHPNKGVPVAVINEGEAPRRVEAVTGACMLLHHQTWESLKGLDENFIIGDFEDSDLCLRLWDRGLYAYYAPGIAAYHLERQSQSLFTSQNDWKYKLTVYNCWRQNHRWGEHIPRLKQQLAGLAREESSQ